MFRATTRWIFSHFYSRVALTSFLTLRIPIFSTPQLSSDFFSFQMIFYSKDFKWFLLLLFNSQMILSRNVLSWLIFLCHILYALIFLCFTYGMSLFTCVLFLFFHAVCHFLYSFFNSFRLFSRVSLPLLVSFHLFSSLLVFVCIFLSDSSSKCNLFIEKPS